MQRYVDLIKRRRQYRLMLGSQVVSLMGDWFNTIACVILVNRYTDSTLAVGGLFLARSLPFFFLGPFAGVVADRFDRKQVLLWSNILRVPVVLGILLVHSPGTVWLVYALSVLQFSISTFFEPAYAAITPSLVARDELLSANALGSIIWSAMLAIGAAIGGAVANWLGVSAALIIDAGTFAIAAMLIFPVQPEFLHEKVEQAGNHFKGFVDGLRYVRAFPGIAMLVLVKPMSQISSMDVMISVYAERVFRIGNNGATTLGVLFAALGVGAVLGPVMGDLFGDGSEASLSRWITAGYWMIIAGWFLFAVGPTLPVVALGVVLRGMGGSINWTYSSVLLQMKVPDHFLGRVFGLDFTLFMLTYACSVWLTSLILDQSSISPRTFLIYVTIASLIPLGLWMIALRLQRVRRETRQQSMAQIES